VLPDDEVPLDLPLATDPPLPGATATPAEAAVVEHTGRPVAAITLPILTYHWIRVNPVSTDQLGFHLSVTPEHFAQQMAFLHYAGVHTLSLGDAMAALQTGKALPPRSVVLTFDDGYGDFATAAAPVLQREGMVGTVFVVTGFLGHTAYMTADQVKQVEGMGMVIGCHTVNHLDLARVPAALAQAQISVSHQQLEELTGHKVLDFAYPYGGFTPAIAQMVLANGFREAVTTRGGITLAASERGVWPRLHVDGADNLNSFAYKALAALPAGTVQSLLQGFSSGGSAAASHVAPRPSGSPSPGRNASAGAGTMGSRRYA
jgi:peptidoglycan/xylan/chitin deacetylase (PgdA/CDA1 family)